MDYLQYKCMFIDKAMFFFFRTNSLYQTQTSI